MCPFPPSFLPPLPTPLEGDPNWEMKPYADLAPYYGGAGPAWQQQWIPDWKARELRQAYWAATSYADEMAGIVLDALDRSPRRKAETVVVLTSDHGYRLGDQEQWGKIQAYEATLKVPFIVRAPSVDGIVPGRVVRAPSEALLGIFPTLLELTGVLKPMGLELDGHSLVPLLTDPGAATTGLGCAHA